MIKMPRSIISTEIRWAEKRSEWPSATKEQAIVGHEKLVLNQPAIVRFSDDCRMCM
jgi:hypothetical protein